MIQIKVLKDKIIINKIAAVEIQIKLIKFSNNNSQEIY